MAGSLTSLVPKKSAAFIVDPAKLRKHRQDLSNDPQEPPRPTSPVTECLDKPLRRTFHTGRPLLDTVIAVQCRTCKRPMISHTSAAHIRVCVQKHKEKVQRKKEQKEANRKAREARDKEARMAEAEEAARALAEQDEEDDDEEPGQRPTGSKKRKAGDEGGDKGPLKKRSKKELEALAAKDKKLPKPKGPVDVERQCGVPLPNGAYCARSLTCKSHSMGAKRAVPGRSKPYDQLLQQYQKKNQAKQQKAAIQANAERDEDFVDPAGPVNSDEETEQVMAAIERWQPKPLVEYTPVPLRKRYQYIRVRDMLGQALRGSGGRSMFNAAATTGGGGTFAAPTATPTTALHEEPSSSSQAQDERRRSSAAHTAPRQTPMQASSSSRKASMASMGTPATPTVDTRA